MDILLDVFLLRLDAPSSGSALLRLHGHLDGSAARQLLHAAADVVRCGCSRLVVDLDGVTSWDAEATFALTGCDRLGRWLPEGVGFLAHSRTARVLAACAGVDPGSDLPTTAALPETAA